MQTITLRKDPASLVLVLDEESGSAVLLARGSDDQIQTPRVIIDTNEMSISLFNSSDLGVTVDNVGLATIHRAKIEGELIMQDPATGNWFQFRPDSTGTLVGTPV